jgi:hypothetical protein
MDFDEGRLREKGRRIMPPINIVWVKFSVPQFKYEKLQAEPLTFDVRLEMPGLLS